MHGLERAAKRRRSAMPSCCLRRVSTLRQNRYPVKSIGPPRPHPGGSAASPCSYLGSPPDQRCCGSLYPTEFSQNVSRRFCRILPPFLPRLVSPDYPLEDYARVHPERNRAIAAAYASGGYTMQQIGDYFRIHYSRVGKLVRADGHLIQKAKGKTSPRVARLGKVVCEFTDSRPCPLNPRGTAVTDCT
jgi:hypothetical protein